MSASTAGNEWQQAALRLCIYGLLAFGLALASYYEHPPTRTGMLPYYLIVGLMIWAALAGLFFVGRFGEQFERRLGHHWWSPLANYGVRFGYLGLVILVWWRLTQ